MGPCLDVRLVRKRTLQLQSCSVKRTVRAEDASPRRSFLLLRQTVAQRQCLVKKQAPPTWPDAVFCTDIEIQTSPITLRLEEPKSTRADKLPLRALEWRSSYQLMRGLDCDSKLLPQQVAQV